MVNTKIPGTDTDLREEFNALREQVSDLIKEVKSKSEKKAEKISKDMGGEFERYQKKAKKRLHNAYEASDDSLHELNDYIRENPTSSLLIALGVSYAIFKLLDQD